MALKTFKINDNKLLKLMTEYIKRLKICLDSKS